MKLLDIVYKKSFWIASFCLLGGFILMTIGNTSYCTSDGFLTLTLAPCLLIAGYSFIVVGIMKLEL